MKDLGRILLAIALRAEMGRRESAPNNESVARAGEVL